MTGRRIFFAVLVALAAAPAQAQTAVTRWKGLLSNQVLTQIIKDDGDSVQLKGTSVKTTAAGTATELHLCKDGSFVRMHRLFSGGESLQIGNLSAKSGAGSLLVKVSGKWKIAGADSLSAHVLLSPTTNADQLDDEDRDLNITFDGANTVVNDARWFRMKSPACR